MKNLIRKLIPKFLLKSYHYKLALLGAVFYGFPSRKLKVIGVTGTKGKSTVVEMASKILEEAGFKTASMSSMKFKIGRKEEPNMLKMTMPGRFKIQKFLRQAVKFGCKYAIIEVTSEGVEQCRHKFINFDTAVFNNLRPEHIESHRGFENYRNAKLKLFKSARNIHIINNDDENAKYFLEIPAKEKWVYGFKNPNAKVQMPNQIQNPNAKTIFAENIESKEDNLLFQIQDTKFQIHLLGEFNVYNALATICIGMSQGISLKTCRKALEKIKMIPGRMEVVLEKPFKVIVDYAHIPDALEQVYKTLNKNPLICVLGSCGGGRDKWKRKVMGEIAGRYCKEVIITNEDPYDENPMEIVNQVAEGAGQKAQKILDRKEAIKKAIDSAKPGDTVIITGKGSEPWMCGKNGKKIPWSDKKIAKDEILAKISK